MKKWTASTALLSMLVLTACVTINIYFPASAAERVADEIIEDIQADPKATPAAPETKPADDQQSKVINWQYRAEWALAQSLSLLVSDARAAEANLSIDSPAIRAIRASMKARFPSLRTLYERGAIGESQNGLILLRNAKAVPLKDRARGNQWIDAENRDRNALYKAIAQANGHPEWEADIRETFARRWIANAKTGWWYQAQSGWKQK